METIILSGDKKSEMKLIAGIARKLGLKTRKLTIDEIEDLGLMNAMKTGQTGEFVDTELVVKTLRKK
jgi:hypothetical protein